MMAFKSRTFNSRNPCIVVFTRADSCMLILQKDWSVQHE